VARPRRHGSRRVLTVARVVVGLTALLGLLTACDKPAPAVTVFSGSTSSRVPALCWSADPTEKLDVAGCLSQGAGQSTADLAASLSSRVGTVPVRPDQTIGISVDPALQSGGWYPVLGDSRLTAAPVTDSYYRFQLSEAELRKGPLQLRILALADDPAQVRGLWLFQLVPQGLADQPGSPSPTSSS
jgi:hypothetical protein